MPRPRPRFCSLRDQLQELAYAEAVSPEALRRQIDLAEALLTEPQRARRKMEFDRARFAARLAERDAQKEARS